MTIQRIFSDQEALEQFKEIHPQFNSAQQIAAVPESEFVKCYANYFPDGKKQARRAHQLAVSIQQRTALAWANIRAVVSPALQHAPFNNLPQSFLNYQESIPNYQQIFNNLDFLECDPCRSVLSPAAYFVDIMRFVDDNITQRLAGTVPANTIPPDLTLRSRRPDLFSLRLDCENTFSLVPYIDLVNEVLDGLVANTRQQDAITVLDTEVFPLNLPLNLPLEEIRGYLSQVDLSLDQVYATFDRETEAGESVNEAAIARETLSLSPTELELLQTETLMLSELTQRYGLDGGADLLTALQDVPTFLNQTGLTRQELNSLFYQDLSQAEVMAGLSRLFFVNRADDGLGYLDIDQESVNASDSRRPPQETILNLSLAKLDRIYRFIKLARKLEWSFKELDWALRSLQAPHLAEQFLQFDGVNDYVAVKNIRVLDRSTFTIEAWVNPCQHKANPIISKGQASDHRLQFMLWLDAEGRLAFYDQFTPAPTVNTPIPARSGKALPTGMFSHIAVTINGPTLQFYINGELEQTVTLAQPPQIVGRELNIGRDLNDTSFAGLIADVRIWATVRSAAEIQSTLYQRFTGSESDLLAYWPLTAGVSDLIEDRTPNANHGVLGGDEFVTQPTWVQADLVLDTLPAQLGPETLTFNGMDQFLARRGVAELGLSALTLEAWILVDLLKESVIFAWGNNAEDQTRLEFGINAQGQLRFRSDAISNGAVYLSQTSVVANTLSHVVVTAAEGSVQFYINGSFSSVVTAITPPAFQIPGGSDGDELFVGRGLNGGYFHGRIAEVRLWSIVRTTDQLETYRHRSVPGRSPNLIGYWPLTQVDSEGIVMDVSSHQNDLILGGLLGDFQPQRLTLDLALPTPPIAVPGTVLTFDGDNDVMELGEPRKSLGLGAFEKITVEFWFKPTDIANRSGNTQILYTQGDTEAGLSIYLVDQRVYCVIWTADYERTAIQETVWISNVISPDQWHHVAVVNDESPTLDLIEFHAYLNGQGLSFDSSTHTDVSLANHQKAYHLSPVGAAYLGGMSRRGVTRIKGAYIEGEAHYQHYFAGAITDFRWWKTARSATDIEQQRYAAPAPTDGNLLAYWPMAEGEGLTIMNRAIATDNGSHGCQELRVNYAEGTTASYLLMGQGKQTGQSPLDVPTFGQLQQRNITAFNQDTQDTFEQTYAHYQPVGVDVLTWSNYEYRGRLYISAADGGIGVTVYNRFVEESDRFYRLWRHPLQSTFALSSRDSGRDSLTGILDSAVTPELGLWYRFAFQIQTDTDSTTLRAKIWLDNTEEPEFQMEAVDASPSRLTSGTVGLWSFGAGEKHFDDLKLVLLNSDGTVQDQRLLDENFESYRVDINPADWVGTGDTPFRVPLRHAPDHTTDADDYQITMVPDTVALGTAGNTDTTHAYYVPPSSSNDPSTVDTSAWNHYEFQGRIYIAAADSGGGVTFFNQILQRNELKAYRMGRPSGTNEPFQLLDDQPNNVSFTPEVSQLNSGLVPTARTWYWFRILIRSFSPDESGRNRPHTEVRAKVWEDGTPEPPEFQMTAEDNARILEFGTVGVYADTANAVYFNNLQVKRITTLANQATTEEVIPLFDGDLTTGLNQLPAHWQNVADNAREGFRTIQVQTQALASLDTAEQLYSHYQPEEAEVQSWQNYSYSGRIYLGDVASEVGVTVYSRFTEQQDHFYRLCRSQQRSELHLDAHPADILTLHQSGDITDIPVMTHGWYWFRIAVQSITTTSGEAQTRIRAKVWMDGTLEPDGFQLEATDSSHLRSSTGTVGIWTRGPGLKAFDNLRVTTGATDLFFDNFESYGINQHPAAWRDTPVRSLFEVDSTLLRTRDIGFNLPCWQSIPDVPLFRYPLNRRALGFDGERQHLAARLVKAGDLGSLTLEAWVMVSHQHVAPIWAGRDRASNTTLWVGLNSSNQVILTLQADQTQTIVGTQNLPVRVLTHIALTIDGTTVTIYVDGVVDAQVDLPIAISLVISDIEVGRDFGTQYFAGTLRELRLWNTARGPETFAIPRRYQQLPLEDPTIQESLVGYWPFLETEGNLTVDVSGNGNDLRLGGLVGDRHPIPTFAPNLPDFWQNRQALYLTEANQHLSFSRAADDLGVLQRRTIELWFRVNDPYITRRKQVLYAQGDDQRGLVIYIHDGYLFFGGYNRPEDESCWAGTWLCTNRLKPGQWHHAALVLDGRAEVRPYGLQGYLDGKLADAGPGAQLDHHTATFTLGSIDNPIPFHDGSSASPDNASHWFAGEILELRIWDIALTSDFIRDNHNQVLSSNAPPLAGWWTFDDITDTHWVVADRSTNDQSFTLANDAVVKALVPQPGYQLPILLLDAVTLKDLAILRQLQSQFNLPIDRLTALWFEIEHTGTADGITLYDRLFNPTDLTRDPWPYYIQPPLRWDVLGQELPLREESRAIRSRLMAALQVSSSDLDRAVAYLSTATETPVDLTTTYLNHLYRLTQLPKTLRLGLPDFFRLLELLEIAGIESLQSVGDVKRISDRVQAMISIGITVAELDFFTNDVESSTITVTPGDIAIRTLADDLANQAVELLIQPTALVNDDINDTQALALLAYLRRNNLIQDLGLNGAEFDNFAVVSLTYGGVTDIPLMALGAAAVLDWRQAFVTFEAQLRYEVRSQTTGDAQSNGQPINLAQARREIGSVALPQFEVVQPLIDNGILTAEGVVLQTQVPSGILAADLSTPAQQQRITGFLEQQQGLQRRIQGALDETLERSRTEHANAILANLAELFDATTEIMPVLIDYLASTLTPPVTPLVLTQWFLTIARNPETTPIPAAVPAYFYRLGKLNALVNEFRLTAPETTALLATPGNFGVSNVLNPTLDDLTQLHTFTQLKQAFDDPHGSLSKQLVTFLQLDNPPANAQPSSLYKAILDMAVIWDPSQLQGAIAHFGPDLLLKPDTGISRRVEGLRQLQQAFAQAEILRTQVTTLIELADISNLSIEFYQTQATTLLNLLRALYSDEEWPQVYRPIRDLLAILKRDALLGVAMQDIEFPSQFEGRRSADLLYEYLLLDVQVSSKVETSRIVQAIASVQLYVQRCLLSLESGVNALGIPTDQWNWMGNYRVWEANRKVFLYPESYIEPELRDTKTPFFGEMEQELMQGNIDQATVEQAYSNYLNKFIEVANLKIVGSYLHREPGDSLSEGVLYLIGHTKTEPITYYYRMRQGSDRWLPWKKIDLGINTDIATPVFAFGRLFLFWVEFREFSESLKTDSSSSSSNDERITVFEPTLKYSHLTVNGEWIQAQPYDLNIQTAAQLPTIQRTSLNIQREYNTLQGMINSFANRNINFIEIINFFNQSIVLANELQTLQRFLALINPSSSGDETALEEAANALQSSEAAIRAFINSGRNTFTPATILFFSLFTGITSIWINAIDQAADAGNQAVITLLTIQVRGLRLTTDERQQHGWQRVYAQRILEFAPAPAPNESEDNARVLAINASTNLRESLPSMGMDALTIEFWVNLANPNPNGTRDNRTSTIQVFNYHDDRFVAAVTTVQTFIPGVVNAIDAAIVAANQTRTLLNNTADTNNLPAAADVQTAVRSLITQAQQAVNWAETLGNADVTGQTSRSANLLNQANILLQAIQNIDDADADTVLTRIQEDSRRDALLRASDHLHSTQRNNDATDTQLRFETLTANLEVRSTNGVAVGGVSLNYDEWHHLAITLSPVSGGGYTVNVYRNGVFQQQGQLGDRLIATQTLVIGNQLEGDSQTRLTAQLSDYRFWSEVRSPNLIQSQRAMRQTRQVSALVLYYPLNIAIPGAALEFVRSTLDFSVPVEVTTLQNQRQRERIILFYGNSNEIIRTRRNNQDDQGFSLILSPQNQSQFDLTLSPSFELFVGQNQALITDDFLAASVTAQNALLRSLMPKEVFVRDVHNQPGWYVLDTGDEQFLLEGTPQQGQLDSTGERITLTYNNGSRVDQQPISLTFTQEEALAPNGGLPTFQFIRLSTYAAYDLSVNLFRNGLDGLLTIEAQQTSEILFNDYQPNNLRVVPPPQYIRGSNLDTIDFDGVNGSYYWEIFFHIPFFVANQLNANQSFADAQRWYHYIFDPTQPGVGSDRYWRFLPFRSQQLDTLAQLLLVTDPSDPGLDRFREALEVYRQDPFDPHAIARLRINAYQKAIVMKYIDNLLDWGDSLFMQDTRESVNEAAQLYILAFNLLGPRPEARASRPFEDIGDYNGIETRLTDIPDFITDLNRSQTATSLPLPQNGLVLTTFCVPENPEFLAYWDRIEDRLFKIRHSLNIEGIFRQQALFQPPLDVRVLVQAAAAGNRDIGSLLADVNRAVPHYRYSFVLDQAKSMVDVVKELGGALLEALETKDDKDLSGLEHTHAQNVRKLMTSVREAAIAEAKTNIEALTISKQRSENRRQHFDDLISSGLSGEEIAQLVLTGVAQVLRATASGLKLGASFAEIAPDTISGGAGISSPIFTIKHGGSKIANNLTRAAEAIQIIGDITGAAGEITGKVGEYKRRAQDWRLDQQTANFDVQEIDAQLAIARSQLATAEQELVIHQTEIVQSDEIAAFNRRKFTNSQLYSWLSSRLAGLYFQSYRLAYDFAKAAERALQYELPTTERFINFGHWDGLRRGLLAGESLLLDINRMEKFHLDNDSRFQEIEKTISMRHMFPVEFIILVTTGVCDFQLSERLFNQDYPGHYFRVIKSIALTVNANDVQPYQTINATLTQLGNKALLSPDIGAVRYLMGDESAAMPDASVLRVDWRSNQQIAVSTTTRENGMFGSFDLNFVFDNRYFPFEGTGAVSAWNLEIPLNTNPDLVQSDQGVSFLDIDDIIIHLQYTSKYDRGAFKQAVETEVNKPII